MGPLIPIIFASLIIGPYVLLIALLSRRAWRSRGTTELKGNVVAVSALLTPGILVFGACASLIAYSSRASAAYEEAFARKPPRAVSHLQGGRWGLFDSSESQLEFSVTPPNLQTILPTGATRVPPNEFAGRVNNAMTKWLHGISGPATEYYEWSLPDHGDVSMSYNRSTFRARVYAERVD